MILAGYVSLLDREVAYRTHSNTSKISDLGVLVVSYRFLAIPLLVELLSRYCACVTRAVPLLSIVLALFCFFLHGWTDKQTDRQAR